MKYKFTIKTGDEFCAGTDSNIFVQLEGIKGKTEEVRLNGHISGNAFERNQVDKCEVEFDRDVGDIHTIYLRSDCMYPGSDWLLNSIIVKALSDEDRAETKFLYSRWIKDKKLKVLEVSSGYDKKIVQEDEVWFEKLGAKHHLSNPSNSKSVQKITVSQEFQSSINLEKATMKSITAGGEVGVSKGPITASIKTELYKELAEKAQYSFSKKEAITHEAEYTVDPNVKDLVVQERFEYKHCKYKCVFGDTEIDDVVAELDVRFAGFTVPIEHK